MAGKNAAARQPVLNDMSAEDEKQFEQMRTGETPAPPEPKPAAAAPEPKPAAKPDAAATPAADKPAAPAADQQQPAEGGDRDTRMVPHAAMHEERERRKSAERERDADREQLRVLTERFGKLAEALGPKLESAPQPQQPPEIPDPEKDPVGYIKATYPLVKQIIEERALGARNQRQAAQVQTTITGAINGAMNAEAEFRQTAPDYDRAADHLRNARALELEAIGVAPAQRAQMVQNETVQLAMLAARSGKNFAQLVYGLAKARGYQAPAPAPAPAPAAEKPAAPAAPAVGEQQRIDMARRGQEQGQSLSGIGGAAPKPALTAEKLATMSDAEFAAVLAKLSDRQQREIFGR